MRYQARVGPIRRNAGTLPPSSKSPVDGSTTSSSLFGLLNTLAMPPLFYISHTSALVDEQSSASTWRCPSCARPMKARREGPPPTRMAETMVVTMPRDAMAKMT